MRNQFNENPAQAGYESPAIDVMEIEAEGVLCASGQNEEWNEGTLPE